MASTMHQTASRGVHPSFLTKRWTVPTPTVNSYTHVPGIYVPLSAKSRSEGVRTPVKRAYATPSPTLEGGRLSMSPYSLDLELFSLTSRPTTASSLSSITTAPSRLGHRGHASQTHRGHQQGAAPSKPGGQDSSKTALLTSQEMRRQLLVNYGLRCRTLANQKKRFTQNQAGDGCHDDMMACGLPGSYSFASEGWYRKSSHLLRNKERYGGSQLPPGKVSDDQLVSIVRRLSRPTASTKARVALTYRPPQVTPTTPLVVKATQASTSSVTAEISVGPRKPSRQSSNHWDAAEDESPRFRGEKKVSAEELDVIVTRLSKSDPRKVPDARRLLDRASRSKLGLLASYRWQGVKQP